MKYQYQVDYGNGYEDVFLADPERLADGGEKSVSQWLADVEKEAAALRARILRDGEVVDERDFTCTVLRHTILPDGSSEYLVQCSGGNITVRRRFDGEMTSEAQTGFTGDADAALARAFEAVRKLGEK